MLPSIATLRFALEQILTDRSRQGHQVDGMAEELKALPDSYDALVAFEEKVGKAPLRPDWRYEEPEEWEAIQAASDPGRSLGPMVQVDPHAMKERIETAFLGSVCGCILGKPLEVSTDLATLEKAGQEIDEWPLTDYVTEKFLVTLKKRHPDWVETVRENIRAVAPDDDLNYRLIGLMLLEQFGKDFQQKDLMNIWWTNLPTGFQWGPERVLNLRHGLHSLGNREPYELEKWVRQFNPGSEFCGALIRVDTYGYACPGHPALAAELAFRDSSATHRRTGVYSSMFHAAALAAAFVVDEPLACFDIALKYIPQKSRYAETVRKGLDMVRNSKDFRAAYEAIHAEYLVFGHCHVHQETATVFNTLKYARDIGHGIGLQVMQGNDTDSFGATAGSLLGAFMGPEKLPHRWLKPFNDTFHCTVAGFREQRLSKVAARISALAPKILGA